MSLFVSGTAQGFRKTKHSGVFSGDPVRAEYDVPIMRPYSLIVVLFLGFGFLPGAAAADKWTEVKSPHFTVFTDAGEKRGRDVALRLEQMQAVFGVLMGKKDVTLSVPLQVLAFRNNKGLKQVAPLFKGKPVDLAGLYEKGADQNFIALDLSSEAGWPVVFHEYAHLLLNSNFPPTPLWFDEGFAEFYSSIKLTDKLVEVGGIPDTEKYVFQSGGSLMPASTLLNVQHESRIYNENGDARNMLYAQSWLVVHYMFDNKKLPALQQYFDLTMNQKMPVEPALQRSFGWSFKQFDHEMSAYRDHGNLSYYSMAAPANMQSVTYTARSMEDAGALGAVADMHFSSPDYRDKAIGEYEQVLKLDPHNTSAQRGLGYAYMSRNDLDAAEPHIAEAAASGGKDPMVHYYYAMLLSRRGMNDPADREKIQAEAQKAIALNPEMADAYNLLAIALNQAHDLPGAILNQRRAIELKPREEMYQANLAGWYLNAQKYDEAEKILTRLRGSDNPAIAQNAASQLEMLNGSGVRNQPERVVILRPETSVQDNSAKPVAPVSLEGGAVLMIRASGTIIKVDCGGQGATIQLKTDKNILQLSAPNREDISLIGTDKLSCSWSGQKARATYRPDKTNNAMGTLVTLSVF